MSELVASNRTTRVLATLFIILSMLTVWQFVTGRNTQSDVDTINQQLQHLCETGVIDCTGTTGLPGPKGTPGTGISDVSCDKETGQFTILFTSGRRSVTGDCIARDGATGPRGPRGATGARGARGERGSQGAHGNRGPKGAPGAKGNKGANGVNGLDISRNEIRQIVESLLGPYATKADLAKLKQEILQAIKDCPKKKCQRGTLEP